MRMQMILVAVTALVVAADEPPSDAVKAELKKLEGTWRLVSAETDGKKLTDEQIKDVKVVIKDGKHVVYRAGELVTKSIPFTVDPTKKPKTSDDTLPDGNVIRGIYELDGDTLKSCVAPSDKDRPTEFAAKPGSGHTLRVFQREKS